MARRRTSYSAPVPGPAKQNGNYTVDWADLKESFISAVAAGDAAIDRYGASGDLSNAWRDVGRFMSSPVSTTVGYVRNGYDVMTGGRDFDIAPVRKRRRLVRGEEGELDLTLAWSGATDPYLDWEKRERKPGLRVNVEFSFNWRMPAATVAAFGKWVAETLAGLEQRGYDLEVTLDVTSTERPGFIRVKKENEASDFRNWSALFSPDGYRTLGLHSLHVIAGQNKERCAAGHGNSAWRRAWGVSFDQDSRTLGIKLDYMAEQFPADRMTEQLSNLDI